MTSLCLLSRRDVSMAPKGFTGSLTVKPKRAVVSPHSTDAARATKLAIKTRRSPIEIRKRPVVIRAPQITAFFCADLRYAAFDQILFSAYTLLRQTHLPKIPVTTWYGTSSTVPADQIVPFTKLPLPERIGRRFCAVHLPIFTFVSSTTCTIA